MRKLKLGIVSVILTTCLFSAVKTTFSQNINIQKGISIDYPDYYFTGTATFSGNRNKIYFNDVGNNGFGLFFLGTGIENGPYTISTTNVTNNEEDTTLSCSGQLNGYYSFSFNDFGMLPLDSGTQAQHDTNGINYITGGLYYNCRQSGTNTIYTGVYGYIQRNYNSGNIHEIRAGINRNGAFNNPSLFELIYSDNFRNINRALSGQYHDNLAKNSQIETRLFGDFGILSGNEEIKATGTLDDPYFILPYESYKETKMYIKSSKENTHATLMLTEFDNNGQATSGYYSGILNNQRTDFGFYGYSGDIAFSQNDSLNSGIITLRLTNTTNENETWTQSIRFEIAEPTTAIPDITINHTPGCSTGINVTATVTQKYGTFTGNVWYTLTGGSTCDSGTTLNRSRYQSGQTISLLESGYNGQYICFKAQNDVGTRFDNRPITGIDLDGPTFDLVIETGYECQTLHATITNVEQIGCATLDDTPYSWDGTEWGIDSGYNEYNSGHGERIITGYVKDALGNYTYHTGKIMWWNTQTSITTGKLEYPNTITGTTTLYEDLIESMGVKDGDCGSSTISTGTMNCTGNGMWIGNGISVTPPANAEGTGQCTVAFYDDDGAPERGTVIYRYDTKLPNITITGPGPACSQSKTFTGSISNETGTLWYSTGTSMESACSGTMTTGTSATFSRESDSGTYLCFIAMDSNGNTSVATTGAITNIDRTPPTYQITTGSNILYECQTETIRVTAEDGPCAGLSGYRFGYQGWGTGNTYSTGKDNTGTLNMYVSVMDNVGNQTGQFVTLTRQDRQITGKTGIFIGNISEKYSFDPIESFGLTGRGECEYIQVYTGECQNATQTLSGSSESSDYTLTITPYNNAESGQCIITFTDGDTTITGTITFSIPQEYPVVLNQTAGFESGELKILNNGTHYIDTGKVSAELVVNGSGVSFDDNDVIQINSINFISDNGTDPNNWLKSAMYDIDLNININIINDKYGQCSCDTGYFGIIFDTGFVTDPAGNPSEKSEIESNNIYIAGNYVIIESGDDKRVSKPTLHNNGIMLTGYLKDQISEGTGSIICTGSDTCPGFSCSQSGVTGVINLSTPKYFEIELFGEHYLAPFYYKFNLKIDPITYTGTTTLTGCKIEIKREGDSCSDTAPCDYSFTEININLVKRPIKAGRIGSENYREGTLGTAIREGSGDDGFLFFITNPQDLASGGALGNIKYTINFNSGVADEFYYITGSAIVNGFKEDLNIKRPTFNYENPRNYLFKFPEYTNE